MSEQLKFTVPPEFDKISAKFFLKGSCGISTRMITRLKREKDGILMNGKILRTVDFVEAGAEVVINLPEEKSSLIEPIEGKLDIIYEDEFLLAVNKPPFLPVHPVKQHQTDTLANIVMYYANQRGENYIFRAHNRLDRNTSGIVVIAKDKFTINKLKNNVQKKYFAFAHGKIIQNGTIKAPIGLLENSKIVRHVLSKGTPAITHYSVISLYQDFTFISLVLETGKTHQIRCHMSYLGHPLLGDDLYGGSLEMINRQALHCGEVSFVHPVTGERLVLTAELPEDMKKLFAEKKT